MKRIKIEKSWSLLLKDELSKSYFTYLIKDLAVKYENKQIFPPFNQIFNALNLTSLDKIKVIIVGQDPYHGLGQAHGLAFSVSEGVKIPPSLLNIYKELKGEFINFNKEEEFLECKYPIQEKSSMKIFKIIQIYQLKI